MNIKVDLGKTGIEENDIIKYQDRIFEISSDLLKSANSPNDFVGWLKLPSKHDKHELEEIKKAAKQIRFNSDVLIVIGIGGSYLGARAVIDSLTNNFHNLQKGSLRKSPQILYVGNNLSESYINDLINLVLDKEISINVISKSGTTIEPAIAFRIFRTLLEEKYGYEKAKTRIFVTTDKEKGALKELADKQGYKTFIIPDNIGGRYSVLTPVGLLPIAVAGIDIDELMEGARFAEDKYLDDSVKYNACYRYAIARNILYHEGKTIEVLTNYEPKLHYITEWWKQLFGESEGKDQKGIFPVGMDFTTDLHSLGQYMQDGRRVLIETTLEINEVNSDMTIKADEDNVDNLNFLEGKTISYINKMALEGTIKAHVTGGVPNIKISLERLDARTIGHLIYFFEKACAVSGNLLMVNPFNQPGVEEYKKNMFELLNKPKETKKPEKEEKSKKAGRPKKAEKIAKRAKETSKVIKASSKKAKEISEESEVSTKKASKKSEKQQDEKKKKEKQRKSY